MLGLLAVVWMMGSVGTVAIAAGSIRKTEAENFRMAATSLGRGGEIPISHATPLLARPERADAAVG
jgi:hypothetical protein